MMAKAEKLPTAESQPVRASSPKKKPRGRAFAKGVSGNPAGRPPGSRNKATELAQQLLDREAEALARTLIERALQGDSTALRLCVERLLPIRKDRAITLPLPPITSPQELARGFTALVAAVSQGEITLEEAQRMAALFQQYSQVLEVAELEQRVRQLEARWSHELEEEN
jgi:hypothetical protein